MYSPRNGTIRGSAESPASRATTSVCMPAQMIRWSTDNASPTVTLSPVAVTPVTVQPRRTSPPAATMSSAKDRAMRVKSVMAVRGECNAASPVAWGSIPAISARPIRRSPGTRFCPARTSSASSRTTSSGVTATTSLPHSS
jgi:hypothetical protein